MYVCIYIYTVCMCVHVCVYSMHVCMYVCIYTYSMHVCECKYMCVCIYTHIYVYMHIKYMTPQPLHLCGSRMDSLTFKSAAFFCLPHSPFLTFNVYIFAFFFYAPIFCRLFYVINSIILRMTFS